jgi:Sulfotransferase domain
MIVKRVTIGGVPIDHMLAKDIFLLREFHYSIPPNEPIKTLQHIPGNRRINWQKKSLLWRGFYIDHLEEWFKHYKLGEDILVLQYEKFKSDPHSVLQQITQFLGIDAHEFDATAVEQDYIPPSPNANATVEYKMKDDLREYLQGLFKPYNERLADRLGEEWRGVWD